MKGWALALALAASACAPQIRSGQFLCDDVDPGCPEGMSCVAGRCVAPGVAPEDAGPPPGSADDAGPDTGDGRMPPSDAGSVATDAGPAGTDAGASRTPCPDGTRCDTGVPCAPEGTCIGGRCMGADESCDQYDRTPGVTCSPAPASRCLPCGLMGGLCCEGPHRAACSAGLTCQMSTFVCG